MLVGLTPINQTRLAATQTINSLMMYVCVFYLIQFFLGVQELRDSTDELWVHEQRLTVAAQRQRDRVNGVTLNILHTDRPTDGPTDWRTDGLSPSVEDVPLFSEVLPGEVSTLRVSANVDDDVDHILLRDQVGGQRQVQ